MFERSLLESQATQLWTTITSLTLQCALIAAVIAVPLFHPASLVFHADPPRLFVPLEPAPPPPPKLPTAKSAVSDSAPASASPMPAAGHPLMLTPRQPLAAEDTPPSLNRVGSMSLGNSTVPGESIGTGHNGLNIAVIPARPEGPLRISKGVSAGLLLAPIQPVYPRIAVATRTEGTVIVEAIISRSGKIESAHALSGPAILREAAIDAIRNARYSPYLLNGTPTEVQTTITVTFRLAC